MPCPSRTVGSNPTLSAKNPGIPYGIPGFFSRNDRCGDSNPKGRDCQTRQPGELSSKERFKATEWGAAERQIAAGNMHKSHSANLKKTLNGEMRTRKGLSVVRQSCELSSSEVFKATEWGAAERHIRIANMHKSHSRYLRNNYFIDVSIF